MMDGECAHRPTLIVAFPARATITRAASGRCDSLQAVLESDVQFMGVVPHHIRTAQTASLLPYFCFFFFFWSGLVGGVGGLESENHQMSHS